jgi:hypothetical protein
MKWNCSQIRIYPEYLINMISFTNFKFIRLKIGNLEMKLIEFESIKQIEILQKIKVKMLTNKVKIATCLPS